MSSHDLNLIKSINDCYSWWDKNVLPRLPLDISNEIREVKKFDISYDSDNIYLKVGNKNHEITNFVKDMELKTVFDFINNYDSK